MTFLLVLIAGFGLLAAAVYAVTLMVVEPLGPLGDGETCRCRACRGYCE